MSRDRAVRAYVVFTAVWLTAWVYLGWRHTSCFLGLLQRPVLDPLFPAVLRDPWTLFVPYYAALLAALPVLVLRTPRWCRIHAWTYLVGSAVLALHQGGHQDASYVGGFWLGLWAVWFTGRMGDDLEALRARSEALALTLVALLFLGGTIGKLNRGFWAGEVFWGIYFSHPDSPGILPRIGGWTGTGEWLAVATSRAAVVVEGLTVLVPFVPARWGFVWTMAVAVTITAGFHLSFYSLQGQVLALCAAHLLLARDPPDRLGA